MFLKTAFPSALVKTEAMMPLPLHLSRPTGTKKEERVAYLCEPQVNFSRNISAFGWLEDVGNRTLTNTVICRGQPGL